MKRICFSVLLILFASVTGCENQIQSSPLSPVGSAYFESDPEGAEIWIDETDTGGKTPGTIEDLEEGNHSYILVQEGYTDIKGTFYVKAGENIRVPLSSFTKIPATQPSVIESENDDINLVDFLPGIGETIEGFEIHGNEITSGSNNAAGISYYPESATIWNNHLQ